jgi:hypothetical protein
MASMDGLTVLGVRHHSPACARLVGSAIKALRPAYVLIEGPADMNERLGELLLGHELPIAVFTSSRQGSASRASWSPFCEYSPEWVALTEGHAAGAEVRFIDLPAWDAAFADRDNRYADSERRYSQAIEKLCAAVGMDNFDTFWDHIAEVETDQEALAERLDAYFDALREASDGAQGDAQDREQDGEPGSGAAREEYMAGWIAAAVSAVRDRKDRNVLVVCGGFHRPALIRLAAARLASGTAPAWPSIPTPDADAAAVSYLVPYSFKRLDAFDGYQSGMPSPEYYQRLWELGPRDAAAALTEVVVTRLRSRRQPVSTADLIAARVTARGLASLRGHADPARTDLLDGLVSALVGEALDQPLPWTGRGQLAAGTHPAVVEMVAALSGSHVGRLHPDTPLPPLVHDVTAILERHGLDGARDVSLDLTDDGQRDQSRVLHSLRVLAIPGFTRESGPAPGSGDGVFTERWALTPSEDRLSALIEAGGYGATLAEAAGARLTERLALGRDLDTAASALFDAVLCGIRTIADETINALKPAVAAEGDLGSLGRILAAVLSLWRHDRLLEAAGSAALGTVIEAAVDRVLWLAEGVRGASAPAEPLRIATLVAARDAVLHAGKRLGIDAGHAVEVMRRIAADRDAPPDLRGAAYGFDWSLGTSPSTLADPARAIRGVSDPGILGDWLSGLFALAREQVLEAESSASAQPDTDPADPADSTTPGILAILDSVIASMSDHELLVALPALRQAFVYFPPRERETIANHVLRIHGSDETGRAFIRPKADQLAIARARELDSHVQALLLREGLTV